MLFNLFDVGVFLFQLFLDDDLADLFGLLFLSLRVHSLLFMSHYFLICTENALEPRRSVLLIFREYFRLAKLRRMSFATSRALAD
jgi:hypothetical protein